MKENLKHRIKNFNAWWAVFIVMYNALMFIIPNTLEGFKKYDVTFFSALAAVNVSFVILLLVVYSAIDVNSDEKIYYNIPSVKKSYWTLISVIIVSTICVILPGLPVWMCGTVDIIIIGLNLLGLIKVKTAADIVGEKRENEKVEKSLIKELRAESESIIALSKTEEIKNALVQLNEKLKYSDPISAKTVGIYDDKIKTEFDTIKCLIETNREGDDLIDMVNHLMMTIDERNNRNKYSD